MHGMQQIYYEKKKNLQKIMLSLDLPFLFHAVTVSSYWIEVINFSFIHLLLFRFQTHTDTISLFFLFPKYVYNHSSTFKRHLTRNVWRHKILHIWQIQFFYDLTTYMYMFSIQARITTYIDKESNDEPKKSLKNS